MPIPLVRRDEGRGALRTFVVATLLVDALHMFIQVVLLAEASRAYGAVELRVSVHVP